MEFFKSYQTNSGFTTFKFSEGEYLNYNITMWLFMCAIGVIFSIFISPILMLLRIIGRDDNDSWVFNIIGIVACLYTLLDIHKGWLYSVVLKGFDIVDISNLSALSLAYICGHLWLLIFPPRNLWGNILAVSIIVGSFFLVFKGSEFGPQGPKETVKQEMIN